MSDLTLRDLELVALGAAMGSNCVPCIEFHIPEARKAGLSELEVRAAIEHADRVRQVPARKTLQAAWGMLSSAAGETGKVGMSQGCGCGAESRPAHAAESPTLQAMEVMEGVMSRMMATCGGPAPSAGAPARPEK